MLLVYWPWTWRSNTMFFPVGTEAQVSYAHAHLLVAAGVLAAKALHWGFRQWHEVVSGKHKRRRDLLLTMDQAQDYE